MQYLCSMINIKFN